MTQLEEHRCGICGEYFIKPEYAARCEAQGRPPLLFYSNDVLAMPNRSNGTVRRELLVISSHWVHHGVGVKCPVNGPCEPALTYTGYRLLPAQSQGRAWVAPPEVERGQVGRTTSLAHLRRCRRVATFRDLWGFVHEENDPVQMLAGPDPFEEWVALWELHHQLAYSRRRRKVRGSQLVLLGGDHAS